MRRRSITRTVLFALCCLLPLTAAATACSGGSSDTLERTARRPAPPPELTKAELAEAAAASVRPVTRLRTLLDSATNGGTGARQALGTATVELGAELDTILTRLSAPSSDLPGAAELRAALDAYRRLIATLNGPAAGADPATARSQLAQLDAAWSSAVGSIERDTGTTILPPGLQPPSD